MLRVEFRGYRRQFRRVLQTNHGTWSERAGIVLRLSDGAGNTGYGEIAPLEWFGSETLDEAIALCRQFAGEVDATAIGSISDRLPACQFGFESALEMLESSEQKYDAEILPSSVLLSAGDAALTQWQSHYEKGDRTFKWKIGVTAATKEIQWLRLLLQALPGDVKLRLDANGGLTLQAAEQWLDECHAYPQIEFLEQPLPPQQFEKMMELAARFPTPLALDESVASVAQLEKYYRQGWRGIVVVKAAIAGSPRRLKEFCGRPDVDVVWSSVFETAIARHYIKTRLIAPFPKLRVPGFGTRSWFADAAHDQPDPLSLWHTLTPI